MTWARSMQSFDAFLHAERNFSPHTRRAYGSDLRQLMNSVGADVEPQHVDSQLVRAWLAAQYQRCCAATVGRKLASARCFFRFLLREGEVSADPTAGLPAPKQPALLPGNPPPRHARRRLAPPRGLEAAPGSGPWSS